MSHHEHEWLLEGDDSVEVNHEHVYVHEHCEYVEITGSQHSERLDETFYEYGYDCDATRTTMLCVESISWVDDTFSMHIEDDIETMDEEDLWLAVTQKAGELLAGNEHSPEIFAFYSHDDGVTEAPHVRVEHDDEEYLVEYRIDVDPRSTRSSEP